MHMAVDWGYSEIALLVIERFRKKKSIGEFWKISCQDVYLWLVAKQKYCIISANI